MNRGWFVERKQWGKPWIWLSAVVCLSGCGTPVPPEIEPNGALTTDIGASAADNEFHFEEDSDPILSRRAFVETELLVQPYPGAAGAALSQAFAAAEAEAVAELADIGLTVLKVPKGKLHAVAGELIQTGLIESVAKNYVYEVGRIPNDSEFLRQTHLAYIAAPEAWDVSVGSASIVVGVVDTGVDGTHPDLAGKLLPGWNVYENNSNSADVQGHGTLVAGVAGAASNNMRGVAGAAWDSPILPVRAADASGKSNTRFVSTGILWASSLGAKVINVSFAPLFADRVIRSAVEQAYLRGCIVVMSAGNAGGTHSAAGYDEGLFVGAIDVQSNLASFSDRGPFIDLVAPGVGVLTTARGGLYQEVDGTSFASPLVAGAAAVVWSVNSRLRPVTIVDTLKRTATDVGDVGVDGAFGFGAIHLSRAVRAAQDELFTPDTMPPTLWIKTPVSGAKLAGRASVSVEARDDFGIADVVLSMDGAPFATDSRREYQFVIDTSYFATGSHELAFQATDIDGNKSRVARVTVSFEKSSTGAGASPSTIAFTSPSAGSAVSGDVLVQASLRDSDGLSNVEWLVDGAAVFASPISGTYSGVSYLWRTGELSRGAHTISLAVTDAVGNRTTGRLEVSKR